MTNKAKKAVYRLNRKANSKQQHMFPTGADLPLFSGTPAKVTVKPFIPQEVADRQVSFADCPICFDTGAVDKKVCTCKAGQELSRIANRERGKIYPKIS